MKKVNLISLEIVKVVRVIKKVMIVIILITIKMIKKKNLQVLNNLIVAVKWNLLNKLTLLKLIRKISKRNKSIHQLNNQLLQLNWVRNVNSQLLEKSNQMMIPKKTLSPPPSNLRKPQKNFLWQKCKRSLT